MKWAIVWLDVFGKPVYVIGGFATRESAEDYAKRMQEGGVLKPKGFDYLIVEELSR